jgi:hypothetical protein
MRNAILALALLLPVFARADGWSNSSHDFYRPSVKIQFWGSSGPKLLIDNHEFPTEHFECSSTKRGCRASYWMVITPSAFPAPLPGIHEIRVNPTGELGAEAWLGTFDGSRPLPGFPPQFPAFEVSLSEGMELRWRIRSGPPFPCIVLGLAICYIRRDELVFRMEDRSEIRFWRRDRFLL